MSFWNQQYCICAPGGGGGGGGNPDPPVCPPECLKVAQVYYPCTAGYVFATEDVLIFDLAALSDNSVEACSGSLVFENYGDNIIGDVELTITDPSGDAAIVLSGSNEVGTHVFRYKVSCPDKGTSAVGTVTVCINA